MSRKRRRVLLLLAAFIFLLGLYVLHTINAHRFPTTARTSWSTANHITHALGHNFGRLPGVRAADVYWSPGNITNPASCDVYIVLKAGAVVGNIENIVIKSVWQSKLEPLDGISVTINRLPGPIGVGYAVVVTNPSWPQNDVAKLTREFGPRPL